MLGLAQLVLPRHGALERHGEPDDERLAGGGARVGSAAMFAAQPVVAGLLLEPLLDPIFASRSACRSSDSRRRSRAALPRAS